MGRLTLCAPRQQRTRDSDTTIRPPAAPAERFDLQQDMVASSHGSTDSPRPRRGRGVHTQASVTGGPCLPGRSAGQHKFRPFEASCVNPRMVWNNVTRSANRLAELAPVLLPAVT